jgi:hypothetical protein
MPYSRTYAAQQYRLFTYKRTLHTRPTILCSGYMPPCAQLVMVLYDSHHNFLLCTQGDLDVCQWI